MADNDNGYPSELDEQLREAVHRRRAAEGIPRDKQLAADLDEALAMLEKTPGIDVAIKTIRYVRAILDSDPRPLEEQLVGTTVEDWYKCENGHSFKTTVTRGRDGKAPESIFCIYPALHRDPNGYMHDGKCMAKARRRW
jgi:hypothetical protein